MQLLQQQRAVAHGRPPPPTRSAARCCRCSAARPQDSGGEGGTTAADAATDKLPRALRRRQWYAERRAQEQQAAAAATAPTQQQQRRPKQQKQPASDGGGNGAGTSFLQEPKSWQQQQQQRQWPKEELPPAPSSQQPQPCHVAARAKAAQLLARAAPGDEAALAAELSRDVNDLAAALELLSAALGAGSGAAAAASERAAARRLAELLVDALKQRLWTADASSAVALLPADADDDGVDNSNSNVSSNAPPLPANVAASLARSLGRAGLYDTELLASLERHTLPLLPRCSANQLGQLAQGLGELDARPGAAWRATFFAAVDARWRGAGPLQLCSVAGAALRWGVEEDAAAVPVLPPGWSTHCLAAITQQLPAVDSPALLARTLSAAAALSSSFNGGSSDDNDDVGGGGGTLLGAALTQLDALLPDFRPADLAVALEALMALGVTGVASADGVDNNSKPRARPLLPPRLASEMLLHARLSLPLSGAPDLAATFCAFAELGAAGPDARGSAEWVDAALARLQPLLPELGAAPLARLACALGTLRRGPYADWLRAYCARCRVEAAGMTAAQAVGALGGLAAVGVRLDDELLARFCAALRARLGGMSRPQLQAAASALRRMYHPRPLPGRSVASLVSDMDARASALPY